MGDFKQVVRGKRLLGVLARTAMTMGITAYIKKDRLISHKDRFLKMLRRLEIDRAVFFGILARIWGVLAGPITALLIVLNFTPEYQGYYYTFGSLLALQVFVELGLGTVIIQFSSHEWSKLKLNNQGVTEGDKEALSRLSSLLNITWRWYLVGGAVIAFGLGLGGYFFFLNSQTPQINWVLPWFSLCFLTGVSISLAPLWALLEGCNQVQSVYTYRFFQGITTSLFIWVSIISGAKLWSASISTAAALLYALLFLKHKYWNFIKGLLFAGSLDARIDWRKEIFPMQWRIALSWISGYLSFSLFTPVIFHYHGPVIAGQLGITWGLINIVGAISSAWANPKVPRFGMLIAKKQYRELNNFFWRITKIVTGVALAGAVMVWLAIYILNWIKHPLAARFLPLLPTGIFLIAQIILIIPGQLSVYLRAHKKEPLVYLSLVSGLAIGLSTLILGKYYSVIGMATGYLLINLFLVVPVVTIIWYRCRKEWHGDIEAISVNNEMRPVL